ncbi:MAG: short chain dehydrogenase, partial [Actinobacteria bacterium]|nr:short chain dehydrogenase [Actinomycetota bacterium]NIU70666.1 short chain dehydrogenase [Actinomycetota bacterium]NIV90263.1 short chain dehydrogenase [Actinomycetota bacterium]NIW32569.1 short chain dehydrogenase [Actinomycetota bacterium]NIX24774.1 short chain dehydrogenase [Actinomycetota bacterium]
LADQLGGPPQVVTIPTDLTDGASATAMATRVLTEHGVPDVVVANAGLGL